MGIRDGSARKGWSTLWRANKQAVAARCEPEVTVSTVPGGELALWLDAAGHVIMCSGALAVRLPKHGAGRMAGPGTHLSALVRQTFDWLDKPVAEWPATIPLLTFNTTAGATLYCTAVVQRSGGDWLLTLVDISEPMARLDVQDRKAQLVQKTVGFATQIATGYERLPWVSVEEGDHKAASVGTVADWLELVSVRLKLPWAAVGAQLGKERRLCGFYQRWDGVKLPDLAVIKSHVSVAGEGGLLHCRIPGGDTFWLLPYRDAGRPLAWLCFGDPLTDERDLWPSNDEWYQLFSTVANPLLRTLQRQEERFVRARHLVVEQLRCGGWWEYQPDKASLRLARGLLERFGLPPDAEWLAPTQWLPLVDPLDRDEFQVRLDTVQEGRMALALRLLVDGEARWYQWEGELIDGPEGRCLTGFALDIHDMKIREEEAASAQSRLQGLIDSAPGMIYVMDYCDGALQPAFCSASIETLLGLPVEEFLQRPYASYIHAADSENYFRHVRTLLQGGRSSSQYRVRHASGEYRWVQDEALLLRNDRGIPVEVVGLCLDISESRFATERVAASEERYRVLVEDSPAIICRYRPDLSMTFANRMLATSLGLPLLGEGGELVVECDLGEFISAEDRNQAQQRFAAMTPASPNADYEVCVRRSDGRQRWWIVSERGLFDESGKLVEIQAVARDDTELQEARQQLFQSAKMVTLGQMATGLAHEINQPLNVMHMSVTNLLTRLSRDEADPEYLFHKMQRVAEQIQRTATIVDHMRVFGRQSDMEGVAFNPCTSVAGALVLVEERLAKEGVELRLINGELPDVVGHPDRLEQVILNLLMNALYAVQERCRQEPGHQPRIELECAAEGQLVIIRVRDNGLGIRMENIDRLFEPFFTTKPVGDGTGLGLSVSYSIIKQKSGRLFAENTGDGAQFTIELPAASRKA